MKKTLLRLVSLLMVFAFVFTAAGCSDKGDVDDQSSAVEFIEYYDEDGAEVDETSSTASDASSAGQTSSSGNKKPSSSSKVTVDTNVSGDTTPQQALQKQLKDTGKGKTLTFVSTWEADGLMNQCYAQMFKSICGGDLKVIRVDWESMQQKLASMHAAGNAPDLYEMTNQDIPSVAYRGLITDLSKHIDFKSPVYSDRDRKTLSSLSWNGGVYFWPTHEEATGSRMCLFWNKSIFDQAGIPANERPDALVKANNWTWDTFYDLQKRLTNSEKGIYGFACLSNQSWYLQMAATTGEDFIKYTPNGIISNFTSPNIARAMNMMKKIKNPSIFVEEKAMDVFTDGKAAIISAGLSNLSNSKLSAMAQSGIAQIVPVPRDPKQSNYNIMAYATGLAIPVGAKNKELAVNFIKMLRCSDYYSKQVANIYYKQNNYTEQAIQYSEDCINKYNLIAATSIGIKEILSITWKSTGKDFIQSADTWETVAAGASPQVQSILDKLG